VDQALRALQRILQTPLIVCVAAALCAAAWADARTPRQRNVRGYRLDADALAEGFHEGSHDAPVQCVYVSALVLDFTQADESTTPSPPSGIALARVALTGPDLAILLVQHPSEAEAAASTAVPAFLGRAPPSHRR
jgi:hypothetical protein